MNIILNTEYLSVIEKAEIYCAQDGIDIELVYKLPEKKLEIISERSKELPTLYFVSVDLLRKRIENGCFILIKEGETWVLQQKIVTSSIYPSSLMQS